MTVSFGLVISAWTVMAVTGPSSRFLDSTRGQIATLLRRGVRTVEELAESLGMTDNAVRNHLATLERDGIVRQEGVRRGTGAGKPAVLYALQPDAESYFSRAYQPVLAAVLDVVVDELPAQQVVELLDKVGRRLGVSVGGRASGSLDERVAAAAAALRSLGGEVDVVAENGTLAIRGTGCPLSSAVIRRPETCRAVEALVSEIVGAPVRECCARGERPRCCFTVGGATVSPTAA
jgi:predicted ArsR family transcriptional regulator